MPSPESLYAPDDCIELDISSIPAEGIAGKWREIEVVDGPEEGVLIMETQRSASVAETRTYTRIIPGWAKVCQWTRICSGTTVTRVRVST